MRALVVVAMVLGCGGGSAKPAASAASDVRVDRRVELVSIVCALAGFGEYTLGKVNPYRTEVVAAFRPFLSHPAVAMAKQLRAEHGIGYDAPMILAVHLDDQLQLVNAAELPARPGFSAAEQTVRVRFEPRLAAWQKERFGDSAQREADGSLVVSVPGDSRAWLARWVLSFGGGATVLEPEWAKSAVAEAARASLQSP